MRAARSASWSKWGTVFGAVVLAVTGVWSTEAPAQNTTAITCGEIYTISRGDTLDLIARRAYRQSYQLGQYRRIFQANRATLPSASRIEINQQILIPCLNGRGPQTLVEFQTENPDFVFTPETLKTATGLRRPQDRITQSRLASALSTAAAPKIQTSEPDQIRFLTGSDFAPFTEEELPEGGMITDLVRRTMIAADESQSYKISFVNDWASHLSILLPDGAFDLGFPWYKPDCRLISRLSPPMKRRCTDFDFSEPFFEVPVGYYAKVGGRAVPAKRYSDFRGMVICRPKGYFTFDLEQQGLVAPNVILITPRTPGECFEALTEEKADLVVINKLVAAEEITALGVEEMVLELPDLATIQTLHVLAPKSNPTARSHLLLVNRGLNRLKRSGEWFQVVSKHMSEHGKRAQ
ncbi:MAG: transporter substrate-binding domain-containing protein [Pseudomonadota bacterium]